MGMSGIKTPDSEAYAFANGFLHKHGYWYLVPRCVGVDVLPSWELTASPPAVAYVWIIQNRHTYGVIKFRSAEPLVI